LREREEYKKELIRNLFENTRKMKTIEPTQYRRVVFYLESRNKCQPKRSNWERNHRTASNKGRKQEDCANFMWISTEKKGKYARIPENDKYLLNVVAV